MTLRSNHYDVAFEAYLRHLRLPYVAVDETRRALIADASLKSMDFIVYAPGDVNLLVDVKGRRFPSAGESGGHCWENWATHDDISCLQQWQQVFGLQFKAMLLFAYEIMEERYRNQHETLWSFRGREYAFYGVWVDDYVTAMRVRSSRWETVTLPAADFRRFRTPLADLLLPGVNPTMLQGPTL